MEVIFELLGVSGLNPDLNNRLIQSSFCFLIFILLTYFWSISRSKIKANNKDGSGLVYLALAFLLYFILGYVSVFKPLFSTYLVLSGMISFCYLSSLSFFSIGTHPIDHLVSTSSWRNGMKYAAFAWVITASMTVDSLVVEYLDIILCILSLLALGFFISRYFVSRGLRFIGTITSVYFVAFVLIQIKYPDSLAEGKFEDMNTIIIGPALLLSVIVLAYTFNWINELNFYELSNIWLNPTKEGESSEVQYAELTKRANKDTWLDKIAKDELEKVIDEIIILKKHKNQSIEEILQIASRNTRNNNNQLKGIISYEDYQLSRNQISNSLITLARS